MINIAFVHAVAKIGGAERVSQMLMMGLDKSQFHCSLVCPEQGDMSQWAEDQKIDFAKLPIEQPGLSNALATIRQISMWRKWLVSNNISILHTADPYCTRAILIAARLSGVKVLSHFHFPFQREHLQWMFRRMPKVDVCVFCSEDLHTDVGPHLRAIMPKSRLTTIHNGIDVSRFRQQNHVHTEQKRIGIIANLQKRKGHEEFIEMAAILSEAHQNLHFDIIGGDILEAPREALLKAKVYDLNLSGSVTFHGQVPDVLSRLSKLDIVVCASHQEAFPIAILEAMAMGKAIVSTNVNGIPEAIEDGLSGLLVPAHSAEQLAKACLSILKSDDLATQLGQAARERVEKYFRQELFIENFESLYSQMLGK